MIKLGLVGGRGYVGEELLRLAASIDDVKFVFAASSSWSGRSVADVFEGCDCGDLVFSELRDDLFGSTQADAWIIAQPNRAAAHFVDLLGDQDTKIIDISSDFRFDDRWAYGLPERNASRLKTANHVANPGCYATAAQLALLPILDRIVNVPQIFGVSGFSGAGRKPNDKNDPKRLADNLVPYSLTGHTHEREICHHLGRDVQFMPHVAQFFRGISLTISVQLNEEAQADELLDTFESHYQPHALVSVTNEVPEISAVANTNSCIVGGFVVDSRDPRRVVIVSVIDNLRKGAASQALQNVNLMFGRESTRGLA